MSTLWEAAIATTELHMEDTVICDAQRERVAWSTGDGSHAVHGIYAAFGDLAIVDRWLRDWPLTDRGDGMLKVSYPPEETDEYNVPIFMMQWGTRVKEHWLASGRSTWSMHCSRPSAVRSTGTSRTWTPTVYSGSSRMRTGSTGPRSTCEARILGTNAFYVLALEDAAIVADVVDASDDARRWRRFAASVRKAAGAAFWSPKHDCFLDSRTDRPAGTRSELGNALACHGWPRTR